MTNKFAAFILTHGRPEKVYTYETLRKHGYTGQIYLIIDNEDKSGKAYKEKYGDQVIVFDKKAIAEQIDEGDNFQDRRAIIYARNASFEIAKNIGIDYFIQLDDDYTDFRYKQDQFFNPINKKDINKLDKVFKFILSFLEKNKNVSSVAFAQGGDFLGGKDGNSQRNPQYRKCMNSFFCRVNSPFNFIGRINEDVNTYVLQAGRGHLFFTFPNIALQQKQTQANSGGMAELYLDSGTYVKSFYSVMYAPSCVSVKLMQSNHPRLHHSINWGAAVPCILNEKYKKTTCAT